MGRIALAAALALLVASCAETSPIEAVATTAEPEDAGHSHTGDEVPMEWDGDGPAPVLNVTVTGDATTGWVVSIGDVPGFTFSDPSTVNHVPGRGHTHVYVDGALFAMPYEPDVVVPELAPGEHEVKVVLSRSDHFDYASDGELITATAVIMVEGEVEAADVTATVSFASGEVVTDSTRVKAKVGDLVELVVTSDVAEEVHVHGYDIVADVAPGAPKTMRFVADIPGIFEVEMESSGVLLFDLEVS